MGAKKCVCAILFTYICCMRKMIASILAALIIRYNARSVLALQIREWELFLDAVKKSVVYGDEKRYNCYKRRYYTYYKTPISTL